MMRLFPISPTDSIDGSYSLTANQLYISHQHTNPLNTYHGPHTRTFLSRPRNNNAISITKVGKHDRSRRRVRRLAVNHRRLSRHASEPVRRAISADSRNALRSRHIRTVEHKGSEFIIIGVSGTRRKLVVPTDLRYCCAEGIEIHLYNLSELAEDRRKRMQEDFICLGGCGKRKPPSFFVCLHFSLVDRAWLYILEGYEVKQLRWMR